MTQKLKTLFVSHDASQTGAPLFLLGLHRWLKDRLDFESVFLLKLGGKLSGEFQNETKTYLWDWLRPVPGQYFRFLINRVRKLLLGLRLRRYRFDLVYLNSAFCADILPMLQKLKIGRIWILHVHETAKTIEDFLPDAFMRAVPLIGHFIVVSPEIKEQLSNRWGIPEEKATTIYPCSFPREGYRSGRDIREQFGIGRDTFLVGGAGWICARKGTDFFIEAAAQFFLAHAEANVIFLWLGESANTEQIDECRNKIIEFNLQNKVLFVGAHENSGDYFDAFDVLLLPSREDPFPLVALECAAAGKPIICFDRNNGCTEYVDNTCGGVVEYGNTEKMAAAVGRFYSSAQECAAAGATIRQRAEKYTPDCVGEAIQQLIIQMTEA